MNKEKYEKGKAIMAEIESRTAGLDRWEAIRKENGAYIETDGYKYCIGQQYLTYLADKVISDFKSEIAELEKQFEEL